MRGLCVHQQLLLKYLTIIYRFRVVLGVFPEAVLPEDDGSDHVHHVIHGRLVGGDVLQQEAGAVHLRQHRHRRQVQL